MRALNTIFNKTCLILIVLALFLLPSFVFASVHNENTVRLVTIDYPPYYGPQLDNFGFISEIITEAYKKNNYTVEIEFTDWTTALEKSKNGSFDGIFTLWYSTEREKWYEYSDALPANEVAFCSTNDVEIKYSSFKDLRHYNLGIVEDYTYPNDFLESELKFTKGTSDSNILEMLYSKKVDLIVIDRAQAKYISEIEFSEHSKRLRCAKKPLVVNPQYIGFSKNSEGYGKKLLAFNSGLKKILSDGTYDLILKKHGYEYFAIGVDVEENNFEPDFSSIKKELVKQKTESVSEQIDAYINSNPGKTLNDLQKDENFKKIAIQQIEDEEFTFIIDASSTKVVFHNQKEIVNTFLNSHKSTNQRLWQIIARTEEDTKAEGVYELEENEENMLKKYMYITKITAKTADNKQLSVIGTVNLNEFNKSDIAYYEALLKSSTIRQLIISLILLIIFLLILFSLKFSNEFEKINKFKNYSMFLIISGFFTTQFLIILPIKFPENISLILAKLLFLSLYLFCFTFILFTIEMIKLKYVKKLKYPILFASSLICVSILFLDNFIKSLIVDDKIIISAGYLFKFSIHLIIILLLFNVFVLVFQRFKEKRTKNESYLIVISITSIFFFILYKKFGLISETEAIIEQQLITILLPIVINVIFLVYLYKRKILTELKHFKFFLIATIMIIIIGFFTFNAYQTTQNLKSAAIENLIEEEQTFLTFTGRSIEYFINDLVTDVKTTANNPDLISNNINKLDTPLEQLYERSNGDLEGAYKINDKGIAIHRYPHKNITGLNFSNREGISTVLDFKQSYISDITTTDSGKPAISILSPIFNQSKLNGVLRAQIHIDSIKTLFLETSIGDNGFSFLVDNHGETIFYNIDQKTIIENSRDKNEKVEQIIEDILLGKTGILTLKYYKNGKFVDNLIVSYKPLKIGDKRWGLVAAAPEKEAFIGLIDNLNKIWISTILIVIAFIISGMLFNNLITKALKITIVRKTEELKGRNLELAKAKKEIEKFNFELEKKVKARTNQLERAKNRIQRLLELKSQFVNQVAHDLRTPLTPIVALLPLVEKKIKTAKEKYRIKIIMNNIQYLTALVQDTLNISRLDAGKADFNFQNYDISEIISDIIESNSIIFLRKRIKIINKIPKKLPHVRIDKLKIKEVLENLVMNATKFMVNKEKTIKFTAKKTKNKITIGVKDTGIGLTKEQISRIFDEFYKADSSRHEHSSGLGLAICSRIIKKHNGRLWVESEGLNKGSTFYFSIPIAKKKKNEN